MFIQASAWAPKSTKVAIGPPSATIEAIATALTVYSSLQATSTHQTLSSTGTAVSLSAVSPLAVRKSYISKQYIIYGEIFPKIAFLSKKPQILLIFSQKIA